MYKNKTGINVEAAAKAAHEVNRVYCEACGDTTQLPWEDAPEWQRASSIKGVLQIVSDPDTSPEQSHEGWMELKREEGWVYGHVKDPIKKEHPCFVPYADLPAQQRYKDSLFGATVRGVLAELG